MPRTAAWTVVNIPKISRLVLERRECSKKSTLANGLGDINARSCCPLLTRQLGRSLSEETDRSWRRRMAFSGTFACWVTVQSVRTSVPEMSLRMGCSVSYPTRTSRVVPIRRRRRCVMLSDVAILVDGRRNRKKASGRKGPCRHGEPFCVCFCFRRLSGCRATCSRASF